MLGFMAEAFAFRAGASRSSKSTNWKNRCNEAKSQDLREWLLSKQVSGLKSLVALGFKKLRSSRV